MAKSDGTAAQGAVAGRGQTTRVALVKLPAVQARQAAEAASAAAAGAALRAWADVQRVAPSVATGPTPTVFAVAAAVAAAAVAVGVAGVKWPAPSGGEWGGDEPAVAPLVEGGVGDEARRLGAQRRCQA